MDDNLKLRTANTVKWNALDRILSQVLYAVTGIVLANILSEEDFGLVGAILVFQAFANLFVDSGFSSALIQKKSPTETDYSTVLWFNIGIAAILYGILWFAAPLIAQFFQGDTRLIPLSRVMFLSFIINATAIVQTNRLMKRMDVKMIAISNTIALIVSGGVGIWLAIAGYGAWAIVWQSITLAVIKSAILWLTSHWKPKAVFSGESLRGIFKVGSGVMLTSFLNTVFLNIYSFFIGNRVGLRQLGYFTQADKWSKMGSASLSQILTSSFLAPLSAVQDDRERFNRLVVKMNRFTAYILFPSFILLIVMAEPIFHLLFGTKWDPSIVLFQILLLRGIFTVVSSLYSNYILALGKAKMLVAMEILRDGVAIAALIASLPYIALTTPASVVFGIEILLWGQTAAAALTCIVTMAVVARHTRRSLWLHIFDNVPYIALAIIAAVIPFFAPCYIDNNVVLLAVQAAAGAGVYFILNRLFNSKIQKEAVAYVTSRFRKKSPSK